MISPDSQAREHLAGHLLASGKGSLFLAAVIGDIWSGIFTYGGQQVFPHGRGGLHAGHYGLKPASVLHAQGDIETLALCLMHCMGTQCFTDVKRIGGVCATGFALPPGGGRIWEP